MPGSRVVRISVMLAMTSTFFLVEIVVGYMTSSLALLADAFHMLSDVISMGVALYAIKLAKIQGGIPTNTYGWQRAEVLGALINGVFLLALCFTIILDALTRLIESTSTCTASFVCDFHLFTLHRCRQTNSPRHNGQRRSFHQCHWPVSVS